MTARLFVDTGEAFAADAVALLADAPGGPTLRITTDTGVASIPLHTNRLTANGMRMSLEGLAIAIPSPRRFYLPREAVALILGGMAAQPRPAP